MEEPLVLTETHDAVRVLTFNRAAKKNAVDPVITPRETSARSSRVR